MVVFDLLDGRAQSLYKGLPILIWSRYMGSSWMSRSGKVDELLVLVMLAVLDIVDWKIEEELAEA